VRSVGEQMGFVTSEVEVNCGICGAQCDVVVAESASDSSKAHDLDMRNPNTQQILHTQIHACPSCHYCAQRLEQTPDKKDEIRAFIATPAYQDRFRNERVIPSEVGRQFLCASMIQERVLGDLGRAAQYALRAAWACDDDREDAAARVCRQISAGIFERVILAPAGTDVNAARSILIDLYRRSGNKARALALCDELLAIAGSGSGAAGSRIHMTEDEEDEAELRTHNMAILKRVAAFQKSLLEENDTASYTTRDALEYERDMEKEAGKNSNSSPAPNDDEGEADDNEDDGPRGGFPFGGRGGPGGFPFMFPFGGRGGMPFGFQRDEDEEEEDSPPSYSAGARRPTPPPAPAKPSVPLPDEID